MTMENVTGQPLPAVVLYNSVYVLHEVMYAAYTVKDSSGNAVVAASLLSQRGRPYGVHHGLL